MVRRVMFLLLSVAVMMTARGAPRSDQFLGTVNTQWCDNGRPMRLLDKFGYRDPKGHTWWAQKDDVIDGASIPKFLWFRIGGPYEGKYRKASVVHDIACVVRDQSWKATHRMFYDACLRGGVGATKAKIMYGAVYHFGPRWQDHSGPVKPISCANSVRNLNSGAAEIEPSTYFTSEEHYARMKKFIQDHPKISLDQIDSLTLKELPTLSPTAAKDCRTLNEEMPDE